MGDGLLSGSALVRQAASWPSRDIALTNIVWWMAPKRRVGEGVVYFSIVLQRYSNSVGIVGAAGAIKECWTRAQKLGRERISCEGQQLTVPCVGRSALFVFWSGEPRPDDTVEFAPVSKRSCILIPVLCCVLCMYVCRFLYHRM